MLPDVLRLWEALAGWEDALETAFWGLTAAGDGPAAEVEEGLEGVDFGGAMVGGTGCVDVVKGWSKSTGCFNGYGLATDGLDSFLRGCRRGKFRSVTMRLLEGQL